MKYLLIFVLSILSIYTYGQINIDYGNVILPNGSINATITSINPDGSLEINSEIDTYYDINSVQVPLNYNAKARDKIVFQPGFKYEAEASNTKFSTSFDNTIIIPAEDNYAEYSSIDFSTFDPSLPVGSIQSSFNVTPTGAATYTMQIEVPQGIQGIQPNLSVTYNSMGGLSNMGKGFSLSGVSAITRTNQCPYYDNRWGAIDFVDDKFALDGQRLVVTSGIYGHEGSTYGTESYSPVIVTSEGSYGEGLFNPRYFTVENAAGQKLTYGLGGNSFHKVGGIENSPAYMWLLHEVKDNNDNKMLYHYGVRDGEHYLQKIQYIYNGADYLGEIEIVHEEHSQPQKKHVGEGDITGYINETLLVKEIHVKLNGKIYRKYVFDYFEDILPKLYQATIYDGSGNKMNSTKFQWAGEIENKLNVEVNETSFDSQGIPNPIFIPWDYTGDGKTDIVISHQRYFSIYYSDGNNYTNRGSVNLSPGIESTWISPLVCDFDGDDKDELMFVNFVHDGGDGDYDGDYHFAFVNKIPTADSYSYELNEWNTLQNGDSKWNYVSIHGDLYNSSYTEPGPFFLTGDFNGNGKNEICFRGRRKLHFVVHDEDNFLAIGNTIDFEDFTIYDKDGISPFVADFNGDNKDDIFYCDEDGHVTIFSFNDRLSSIVNLTSFDFEGGDEGEDSPIIKLADINGDGKSDFYYYDKIDNRWKYAIWNGNGFDFNNLSILNNINPESNEHEVFFADFNRDGISDILHTDRSILKSDEYTSELNFYLGDNNLNFKHIVRTENVNISNFITGYIDEKDMPTDIDGDGFLDILSCDEDNIPVEIIKITTPNDSDPNTVKTIRDGMNNSIDLLYKPGVELLEIDAHNDPDIHPIRNRPGAMVSQSIANNGITEYEYGTLYYHKLGKGFLGINTFKTSNLNTSEKSSYVFKIDTNYFVSYLSSKYSYKGNTSLSNEDYLYTFKPFYKQFFQRLDSKDFFDRLSYIGNKTSFTYTNSRKVDTIKSEIYRAGGVAEKTELTTNVYLNESEILDNRIDYKTVVTTIGSNSQTQTVDYSFDANWNITSENNNFGDGRVLNKTYSEFIRGNPGKITTSGTHLNEPHTEKFEYDNTLRLVTKHILPNDDFTTSEYDPYNDLVISTTDASGNTSNMSYGAFGELIKDTDPNGNSVVYKTSFSSENESKYKKTINTTGANMTTEYFNDRGQLVYRITPGAQGSIQTKQEYYESGREFGKLKAVYEPTYGSPTIIAEEYFYDGLARIDYIVRKGDNQLITDFDISSYTRTTTITQPNGLYQTTIKNIWGGIESITDNGGTINYNNYSALGEPKSISYSGNTWLFDYDGQGNRTFLSDPDAGHRDFEYDAIGNLKGKKIPTGDTITYNYDNLNRLKKKTSSAEDEGEINYSYVQSGNGKGKIEKIEGYNQIEYNFTYNGDNRLSKKSFNIKGQVFDVNFIYDDLGRISIKTFPDGTAITYSYNQTDGSIKEIKVNDAIVANSILYDAKDRVTQMDLGNNLEFSQEINSYDFPQSRKIKAKATNNPLFYQSYIFDAKENWLLTRKDEIKNIREVFAYDDQKRLIRSVVNSVVQIDMSYFSNGNIDTKSDVGQYHYEKGNHAVTKISEPEDSYLNNLYDGFNSELIQDITFNSINKPNTIVFDGYQMIIDYGPDKHRTHFILNHNGTRVWERYYADNYIWEWRNGIQREITIVNSPEGILGLNITENGQSQFYYTATDYLGSILAIITPEGNVIEQYNYDAWGRRRNADTWSYDDVQTPTFTRIGFTGHEHWDEVQLINMTGRMYDPRVARFLSTDPFVQMPDNTQNLNRYAYAFNNPLIYDDPDGEFIGFVIGGAIIGAYIGASTTGKDGFNIDPTMWNKKTWWKGAITGAIVGASVGCLVASGGAAGTGISTGFKQGWLYGKVFESAKAGAIAWQFTSNAAYTGALNIISMGVKTDFDQNAMMAAGLTGVVAGIAATSIAMGVQPINFASNGKYGLWSPHYSGWLTRDVVSAGLNSFGTTMIEHYYVYDQKNVGELLKAGTLSAASSMLFVAAASGLTREKIDSDKAFSSPLVKKGLMNTNRSTNNWRFIRQQLTYLNSAAYSSGIYFKERNMQQLKKQLFWNIYGFE